MTTTNDHPLVRDYLQRLDGAAHRLPRGERSELVAEIRSHLATGIGPGSSEADILNLLDGLGDPDEIVAAASAPGATTPPSSKGWAALAVGVVGLLLAFVPAVSVVLGVGAIVLGIQARRTAGAAGATDGPATAGVVTGTVAALLGIAILLLLLGVRTSRSTDEVDVQEIRPAPMSPTTTTPFSPAPEAPTD